MKTIKKLAIVFSVFMLASCGDSATKKLAKEINSSYTHDGQQLELVGYLFPGNVVFARGELVTLGLYSAAGQSKDALVNVRVKFGQEANCIYVPEKFKGSDFEIYDSQGSKHGYLTKVKVIGTIKYTNKDWEKSTSDGEIRRAGERKEKTGDPNDYSYRIDVESIEIP